jgi:rhamnogalacturonyl hydrolase YesR
VIKLGKITNNPLYFQKLLESCKYSETLMYDFDENLFFRDGKKDFWSRGNGWVFAVLARIIPWLPADSEMRAMFLKRFRAMAPAIAACQQAKGYWARSLLDLAWVPGFETTGTTLFAYGFLWGINNGYLDKSKYLPVIEKAWTFLHDTALQANGVLGYMQPMGERADENLECGPQTTFEFGVGNFMLTITELHRYLVRQEQQRQG